MTNKSRTASHYPPPSWQRIIYLVTLTWSCHRRWEGLRWGMWTPGWSQLRSTPWRGEREEYKHQGNETSKNIYYHLLNTVNAIRQKHSFLVTQKTVSATTTSLLTSHILPVTTCSVYFSHDITGAGKYTSYIPPASFDWPELKSLTHCKVASKSVERCSILLIVTLRDNPGILRLYYWFLTSRPE